MHFIDAALPMSVWRYPPWPAEVDLCRQAAGGWPHSFWLQHPEGVYTALGAEAAWGCQEAQEEELLHPQEDQTQEEESQVGCAEIL